MEGFLLFSLNGQVIMYGLTWFSTITLEAFHSQKAKDILWVGYLLQCNSYKAKPCNPLGQLFGSLLFSVASSVDCVSVLLIAN